MAEVANAFVTVAPSAKGFGNKLNGQIFGQVDSSGKRAGVRFGTAMKGGALAVLGAAGFGALFLKQSVDAASEAQQSIGATESIFKRFSGTVIDSSKRASQQYGLSANQYRESANLIGSLFKNQGVGLDQLAGKTDTMIGRAADLSAMFGGTTADAVESLGSAFKGEFNPLEKYGITLNQTAINAELAARGQEKLEGSALSAAKQAATMDLIMRQSKDSMGTFANEANTLAGQQQRLGAQWSDMKATIGTALLPVLTQFAGFLNSAVLPAISGLGSTIGPVVSEVRTFVGYMVGAFQSGFTTGLSSSGSGPFAFATRLGAAFTDAFAAIRSAVRTVDLSSFADSLRTTFAAIANVVAGVVSAFAPFVAAVLPTLIGAGQRIAATLLPAVQSIAAMISAQLIPAFQRILPIVTPVVQFLIGVFAGAVIGAIQGAVQAIKGFVGILAGVFNVITALVTGNWSALWEGVKQIVVGVFNAIVGLFRVWLNVGILGIFKQAGKAILGAWRGLWAGLRSLAANATGQLTALASRALGLIGRAFQAAGRAIANTWRSMWNTVTSAARLAWNIIRALISAGMSAIRSLITAGLNAIRSGFTAGWNAVKSATSSAWTSIRTAVSDGIAKVIDLLRSLPGKFTSALGNLGSTLYNAGVDLIAGLIRGITSKIGELTDKLRSVTDLIPDWKGPPARDAKLLFGNGQLIMGGLVNGIESGKRDLQESLSGITAQVPTMTADIGVTGAGAADSSSPSVFHLYDSDGRLMGTMRGVARREVDARASDQLLRSGVYA